MRPFALCLLLSSLGVPEPWLPARPREAHVHPPVLGKLGRLLPYIAQLCCPKEEDFEESWGWGGLIVAVASFCGVPGNNSTSWGGTSLGLLSKGETGPRNSEAAPLKVPQ